MNTIRHRLPVSIALLAALASVAPAQVWTSHGPTGAGVVNDLAVGDGVAYAATPTGVFLSRDGGATWIPTALAGEWIGQVVARAGATVALAVAPSTLYSTRDGGNTWAPTPDVPSMTAAIDPRHPSTLYSGAYEGVWRSTDSGASWQRLSTAPTGKFGISFAFDSRAIYLLDFDELTNRYELHQSVDGGDSWASVSTPIPSPTAVAGGAASGLVYVGGAGSFCRSADSAATWACSSFPSTEAPFLVLAGTNVGIFRSQDRGDSWTPGSAGLRSSAINALALDPQDPSTVWAVGNGFDGMSSGLFRSADGGLAWSLGSGPGGAFRALVIDPEHPSTLYAGGSGVSRPPTAAHSGRPPFPGRAIACSWRSIPGRPSGSGRLPAGASSEATTARRAGEPTGRRAGDLQPSLRRQRPGTIYAGSYSTTWTGATTQAPMTARSS